MAVEFRCEKCGKLLGIEAAPGSLVKCPQCGKRVSVPAGLASLPQPKVPPNAVQGSAAPTSMDAPEGASDGQEDELHAEDDVVMTAMAHVMPWVISLFFHVGLFLIMVFAVMIVVVEEGSAQVIIPDAFMSDDPGARMNPNKTKSLKNQQKKLVRKQFSKKETTVKTKRPRLIALQGVGTPSGDMSPLGLNTGGAKGPRSTFYGSGGNAHHVVFVIDRSGSMIDTFDFVRNAMGRSISRLKEVQDFHIIMFAAGPPIEFGQRRLVPATREYKLQAARFLKKIHTRGRTNPIPALLRAFDVLDKSNKRPGKLIYLLTDGEFPDNEKVLAAIRARNRDHKVLINTYLYGGDVAQQHPEAVKVMQTIARENGGRFLAITDQD